MQIDREHNKPEYSDAWYQETNHWVNFRIKTVEVSTDLNPLFNQFKPVRIKIYQSITPLLWHRVFSVFFFFMRIIYKQIHLISCLNIHDIEKILVKNADTDWNFTISFRHSYFSSGYTKHSEKLFFIALGCFIELVNHFRPMFYFSLVFCNNC